MNHSFVTKNHKKDNTPYTEGVFNIPSTEGVFNKVMIIQTLLA